MSFYIYRDNYYISEDIIPKSHGLDLIANRFINIEEGINELREKINRLEESGVDVGEVRKTIDKLARLIH